MLRFMEKVLYGYRIELQKPLDLTNFQVVNALQMCLVGALKRHSWEDTTKQTRAAAWRQPKL